MGGRGRQCRREGHKSTEALLRSIGCHIYGRVDVNKVAGNLHIAPGKSFQANHMHIHDINSFIARGEAYGPSMESPPWPRSRSLTQGSLWLAPCWTGALT